jgi:ABC-2 type transport system permease protein
MSTATLDPITPALPATATITPVTARPRSGFGAWWRDTLVFTGRQIAHIRQIPEKLLDVTLQPLMFVLLFSYVFSGAMTIGGDYREYLVGGILVQSLAFGLIGPATAMATDIGEGVVDRFRTLPTPRGAYLSGQFLAELLGMVVSIAVVLGAGLVVGWRPHDLGPSLLAGLLVVLFASVMVWIGIFLGLLVRTPDAVMGVGFVVVFPLTFLSNAFVPVDSLPTVLQQIALWNPVSVLVAAVRQLFGNPVPTLEDPSWALQHAEPLAFGICVALLAVVVPLALRAYRIRTRD